MVRQLFDERPESIEVGAPITRSDLVALVQESGLPGLADLSPTARYDRGVAYINQVTSLSSFESVDAQRVGELAQYLAGRTSTLVNINEFARDVELARQSVTKYLAHLEEALVVMRLPGWRMTKDESETDRAKVHSFDAGIACSAARMLPGERPDDLGRLVETLLVTDLVRQSAWMQDPPSCYHWRRSNHDEVELVLEARDGRAVCVEVKVAESVSKKDFRGIDDFEQAHPDAFHRGFVFYSGSKVQPMGPERWAIPFATLRSAAPEAPTLRRSAASAPSRESTTDLWDRILTRLIAMTGGGAIEWSDDRAQHTYTTTTDSGAISIVRQLGDKLLPGVSSTVSSLTVTEDRNHLLGAIDPVEDACAICTDRRACFSS